MITRNYETAVHFSEDVFLGIFAVVSDSVISIHLFLYFFLPEAKESGIQASSQNLPAPLLRKQNTSGRDKDWPDMSSELLNVQLFGSS